jgi:hypothetical protein
MRCLRVRRLTDSQRALVGSVNVTSPRFESQIPFPLHSICSAEVQASFLTLFPAVFLLSSCPQPHLANYFANYHLPSDFTACRLEPPAMCQCRKSLLYPLLRSMPDAKQIQLTETCPKITFHTLILTALRSQGPAPK